MPPAPLVAWTEWLAVVVAIVTGVVALVKGGAALHYKANILKRQFELLPKPGNTAASGATPKASTRQA